MDESSLLSIGRVKDISQLPPKWTFIVPIHILYTLYSRGIFNRCYAPCSFIRFPCSCIHCIDGWRVVCMPSFLPHVWALVLCHLPAWGNGSSVLHLTLAICRDRPIPSIYPRASQANALLINTRHIHDSYSLIKCTHASTVTHHCRRYRVRIILEACKNEKVGKVYVSVLIQ